MAWREVLHISGVSHPEHRMATLQRMMWERIVEPLWVIQNCNLHQQKNHFDLVEEENMAEQPIWYVRNKQNILSSQDRFLAQFDVTTIHRIPRAQKREWAQHLDIAREAYLQELNQRASKQNVITRYLISKEDALDSTTPTPTNQVEKVAT